MSKDRKIFTVFTLFPERDVRNQRAVQAATHY